MFVTTDYSEYTDFWMGELTTAYLEHVNEA